MPILRNVLHRTSREEQAEEDARVAARLAHLFGDGPDDSTPVDGETAQVPVEAQGSSELVPVMVEDTPAPEPARSRPVRKSRLSARFDGEATQASGEALVGVMADSFDEPPDWEALRAAARWGALESIAAEEAADQAVELIDEPAAGSAVESAAAELEPAVEPAVAELEPGIEVVAPPPKAPAAKPRGRSTKRRAGARSKPTKPAPVPCPYCGTLLELPLPTSRRCGQCLHRVVVRHLEGRTVYLAEAVVAVFDAERRRIANVAKFTRDRERWLRLASEAGAAAERVERLAAARPADDVVAAARRLYLKAVERRFRTARGTSDWDTAARIRRKQAADLHRMAGSPVPPTPDVMTLLREGARAELRGVAELSRNAELVSAGCCDLCRADDRKLFRVSVELRASRLPHEGCAKGLCRCRWTLGARDRVKLRRYIRHPGSIGSTAEPQQPEAEPVG